MKVLHVLGELRPSGAETMFCIAAPLFAEQGVEAEILATGDQMGSYAHELADVGYKLHHIAFAKSPVFFYKLFRLMRSGNYDVLHLHTEQANFWIGLVALAQRPSVILQTIHNSFEFTGNLRLRRMIQRRISRFLGIKHISISPSVQATELKHFGLKTKLIPNWYNSSRFYKPSESERKLARANFGIAMNDKVIVSVGNCSKIKNHGALIEAIALLPIELRPIYLHVGIEEDGEPERQLAKDLGVDDRIYFLGPLSDIMPALFAADIFVMPSLFEGFGIAAAEALATGLPAIFTDVAGLRDFVLSFEGLVYTKTDAFSIRDALVKMLNEPHEQLRSRAQNYPTVCKSLFSVEKGVAGYMEVYSQSNSKVSIK